MAKAAHATNPAGNGREKGKGPAAKAARAEKASSKSVGAKRASSAKAAATPKEAPRGEKEQKPTKAHANGKVLAASAVEEPTKRAGAKGELASKKALGKQAASPGASEAKKAKAAASEPPKDDVDDLDREMPEEPSPEALAEAQAEAEKALKEMERQGGGDSTLSRYFREMAGHRVLTPQEEIDAAKEVERLEIGYWEALFALPTAFETITKVLDHYVQPTPPEVAALQRLAKSASGAGKFAKKDQSRWDATALALATKLRALDSDRDFVNDSDNAVHREAGEAAVDRDLLGGGVGGTPHFSRYLEGVQRARRLQQESKNRFVAANLRLVVSIARRYNRGRLPLIDLIQEGNIGLMKAVERFDHSRGYRFSTYASWWIRHAISRALADKGRAVRIPVHMLDTYNRVARATQAIATRTGQEPSPEELEKETGIAAEKLEKIKGYWAETPFSLDRPVNDEDGRKFIDFLEQENVPTPYEQLVSKTWSDEVRRLLDTLSPMEARILRWRFGLDDEDELTLKEIGDKYNLSRERIRQLQEQALAKIRRQIKE